MILSNLTVECGELNQHPDRFDLVCWFGKSVGFQNAWNRSIDTYYALWQHSWCSNRSYASEIDQSLEICLRSKIRVRSDARLTSCDRSNPTSQIDWVLSDGVSDCYGSMCVPSRQWVLTNRSQLGTNVYDNWLQLTHFDSAEIGILRWTTFSELQNQFWEVLSFFYVTNILKKLRFQGF